MSLLLNLALLQQQANIRMVPKPGFTTQWTVSGDSIARTITLPLTDYGTYNCTVYWGDGSSVQLTAYNDDNRIHTYQANGTYQVEIIGECPGWSFNNAGDRLKISNIIHWGDASKFGGFAYLDNGFNGCSNLVSHGAGAILRKASCTSLQFLLAATGISALQSTLLSNCAPVTNFQGFAASCPILASISDDLFRGCTSATNFSQALYWNQNLELKPYIFYQSGQQSTMFAGRDMLFTFAFRLTSPSGFTGVPGTAPDLWNCTFKSVSSYRCFTNHATTTLNNYASIPANWK